ncbi:MAG: Holliday junction branch migration protein RuvA [Acidimicrobiales bacterium]|nr:Holliday junction branch migration protein RuvA [Acidimicrobiales bacterium]
MIASLRGRVVHLDRSRHEALIELPSGVGYKVILNDRTMSQIDMNGETLLYTHHQYGREGDQRLIGFLTRDEVVTLETLVATPKVGPSMALSILNTYGPSELAIIVSTDDVAALCDVSGVGKTTAQRLLVEMKDKLVVDLTNPKVGRIGSADVASVGNAATDVTDALLALGYTVASARSAVKELPSDLLEEGDTGRLLKRALQYMEPGN